MVIISRKCIHKRENGYDRYKNYWQWYHSHFRSFSYFSLLSAYLFFFSSTYLLFLKLIFPHILRCFTPNWNQLNSIRNEWQKYGTPSSFWASATNVLPWSITRLLIFPSKSNKFCRILSWSDILSSFFPLSRFFFLPNTFLEKIQMTYTRFANF